MRLIVCEATQRYSNIFDIIRKYQVVNGKTPIVRLLFLLFKKWKTIIPFKIKLLIRSSNSIKSNLQNKHQYGTERIK